MMKRRALVTGPARRAASSLAAGYASKAHASGKRIAAVCDGDRAVYDRTADRDRQDALHATLAGPAGPDSALALVGQREAQEVVQDCSVDRALDLQGRAHTERAPHATTAIRPQVQRRLEGLALDQESAAVRSFDVVGVTGITGTGRTGARGDGRYQSETEDVPCAHLELTCVGVDPAGATVV